MARHPEYFFTGGGGVAALLQLANVTIASLPAISLKFWSASSTTLGRSSCPTALSPARSASGGAIFNREGYMWPTHVFGNRGYGGGIYNEGVANVFNSTFSGNFAFFGAAIYNYTSTSISFLRNNIVANSLTGKNCFNFGAFLYDAGGNRTPMAHACLRNLLILSSGRCR